MILCFRNNLKKGFNMSFYTIKSLRTETIANWAAITKEVPKENFKLQPPKVEIQKGFEAYEAARSPSLNLIILGGPSIRTNQKLINNFGTLATDPQVDQKKVKKFMAKTLVQNDENAPNVKNTAAKAAKTAKQQLHDHLHQGAMINESNWWPYRNDLFILGAIHGERSFHIVGKKGQFPADELLWDYAEKRPHVLGRELIMLKAAGYQWIDAPETLGIVLAPPVDGPKLLTLSEMRDIILKVRTVEEIKTIFETKHSNDCERRKIIQ